MIYCAATESGYEDISGKSISVFVPEFGKDDGLFFIRGIETLAIESFISAKLIGANGAR